MEGIGVRYKTTGRARVKYREATLSRLVGTHNCVCPRAVTAIKEECRCFVFVIHKGYLNDTVVLTSAPEELPLSSSSTTTADLLVRR